MNDQQTVTGIQSPDWAPDNCPPDVYKLIDDEQYLQDLGLRGLASGDSKELRQAVRKLRGTIDSAYELGINTALDDYVPEWSIPTFILGYLAGAFCGALVVYAAFM